MVTQAPVSRQDRPGDVPWVVPVAVALPLVGLAMLLARPELDMEWEHHPSHFWLVLSTAAVSVALAYVTNVAAGRYRDARFHCADIRRAMYEQHDVDFYYPTSAMVVSRAAMQQVMAMQAEAVREKRARLIKAEAESEASLKLSAAAAQMMQNPAALELRRMQMIAEVGAENNSTTVMMIPSDFVSLAQSMNQFLQRAGAGAA